MSTTTDITVDPSTSPVAPSSAPAGDFTSSSFWTSPSSYITIATYLLPILTGVFHRDFSQYAQAIAQLAPLVATAVLLVMRGLHKRTVITANASLALQRTQHAFDNALSSAADNSQIAARIATMQAQVDAFLAPATPRARRTPAAKA